GQRSRPRAVAGKRGDRRKGGVERLGRARPIGVGGVCALFRRVEEASISEGEAGFSATHVCFSESIARPGSPIAAAWRSRPCWEALPHLHISNGGRRPRGEGAPRRPRGAR